VTGAVKASAAGCFHAGRLFATLLCMGIDLENILKAPRRKPIQVVALIVRAAVHPTLMVTVSAVATTALAGCTFGDEPGRAEQAQPGLGGWFDDNCVPVECLFECCDGWNWSSDPHLRGENVPGSECEKARTKNLAYSEYVYLMRQPQNLCSDEFAQLESGYCHVINPPDAVEGFRPDGQVVYAGLNFSVCAPKGQPLAHPLEDVEFIPQE
jgi:hypothetical protein